jgi:hypothetical protein
MNTKNSFIFFNACFFLNKDLLPYLCKRKDQKSEKTFLSKKTWGLTFLYTVAGECAVNGVKVESQLTWLPPGYTAPLEPRLLELDTRDQ